MGLSKGFLRRILKGIWNSHSAWMGRPTNIDKIQWHHKEEEYNPWEIPEGWEDSDYILRHRQGGNFCQWFTLVLTLLLSQTARHEGMEIQTLCNHFCPEEVIYTCLEYIWWFFFLCKIPSWSHLCSLETLSLIFRWGSLGVLTAELTHGLDALFKDGFP